MLVRAFVVMAALLAAVPAVATAGRYDRYLASASVCPGQNTTSGPAARQERTMRCLINYARGRRGLRKLAAHPRLARSADLKARDLLRCQRWSHRPCKGKGIFADIKTVGYARPGQAWSAGENLAYGVGPSGTPREMMRLWLHSAGHRRNILSRRWRHQGVALRRGRFLGSTHTAVWTSHFAWRR